MRSTRPKLTLGIAALAAVLLCAPSAQAADFTVTNLGDSGAGSFRQAITDAAAPGPDRILFQPGLNGTITLASALPTLQAPLDVVGPGADRVTISGNDAFRVLTVNAAVLGQEVTISGLTLSHGMSGGEGGAVRSASAAMTFVGTVIADNRAGSTGGLSVSQTLVVRDSTVTRNTSNSGPGGIAGDAGVTIERSTIANNPAGSGGSGGGLYGGSAGAAVVIRDSTIAGNSAPGGGTGGGIAIGPGTPSLTLTNSLVANNTSSNGPDINSAAPVTATFSLIENTTGATITGTPNVIGQDPMLGPLADNGGPTQTMALLPGSPALDSGSASGGDQRSATRPYDLKGIAPAAGGNSADIGAYERALCGGVLVNEVGTPIKDTLRGTKGPDGILGLLGKDTILGLGGNDGLCGGKGRDVLRGGGGRDVLSGGNGADLLVGGKGRDKLKGGPGRDSQKQ